MIGPGPQDAAQSHIFAGASGPMATVRLVFSESWFRQGQAVLARVGAELSTADPSDAACLEVELVQPVAAISPRALSPTHAASPTAANLHL
jgi:hypothetical protein